MSKTIKPTEVTKKHNEMSKKTWVISGGAIAVALFGSYLLYSHFHKQQIIDDNVITSSESPSALGDGYQDTAKQTLVEKQKAKIDTLETQLQKQKLEMTALQNQTQTQIEAIQKKIQEQSTEMKKVKSSEAKSTEEQAALDQTQTQGGQGHNQFLPMGAMNSSAVNLFANTTRKEYAAEEKDDDSDMQKYYIMPGTFTTGVLLTGALVDAGVNGSQNGTPINIQVTTNAKMPNGKIFPMKGCRVVANSYGDISSERAFIYLDTLSCIGKDGKKYEASIQGIANGQSGGQGLRGNVVMRNDKIVTNAFIAGMAAGLGDATAQSFTNQTQSDMTGLINTNVSPSKILPYAAFSGVSKASEKISDYWMKLADQYHPVIEIMGGSHVNLWLEKGAYLMPVTQKSKSSAKAHPSINDAVQSVTDAASATKSQPAVSQAKPQDKNQVITDQANSILQQIQANTAKFGTMNSAYIGGN